MTEEQWERVKEHAALLREEAEVLASDYEDERDLAAANDHAGLADAIDAALKRIERLEGSLQLIGSTLEFTREYGAVRSIIAKALEGRD